VNELIKKYNREKITVWGNFRDKTTTQLFKLASQLYYCYRTFSPCFSAILCKTAMSNPRAACGSV